MGGGFIMKNILYLATVVSTLGLQQMHAIASRILPEKWQSLSKKPECTLYISKSQDPRSSYIAAIEDRGGTSDEIRVNLEGDGKTVTFNLRPFFRDHCGFPTYHKGPKPRQIQSPDFYQSLEDVFNGKSLQNSFVSISLSDKSSLSFQVDPFGYKRWTDGLYRNIRRFYTEASPVNSDYRPYRPKNEQIAASVCTETIKQPTSEDLRKARKDLQKLRAKLGSKEFEKLLEEMQHPDNSVFAPLQ
jgi:hypothetical protein